MTDPTTVGDGVEDDRQRLVTEFATEGGPDWATHFQPGTVGCHELLDRTALVADLIERQLVDHPACVSNPDWYAAARRAADALSELYQAVGAAHLAEDEPDV